MQQPDEQRFVFEAVKMQMNQTKDGWALALRLHPDDLTLDLMQLPVGQRLGVALMPLDDDDGAYRHREAMAKVAKEERLDAAHKKKYNALLNGILSSPYVGAWAEDLSIDDDPKAIEAWIVNDTFGKDWAERYEKLSKIAEEVRKYVTA